MFAGSGHHGPIYDICNIPCAESFGTDGGILKKQYNICGPRSMVVYTSVHKLHIHLRKINKCTSTYIFSNMKINIPKQLNNPSFVQISSVRGTNVLCAKIYFLSVPHWDFLDFFCCFTSEKHRSRKPQRNWHSTASCPSFAVAVWSSRCDLYYI
jgi:hypothetical protein